MSRDPGAQASRDPGAQASQGPGTLKKKIHFFEMAVFVSFFRDFPIRQNQLSQILMKPSLSILIFQRELEFSAPEAIPEDRF